MVLGKRRKKGAVTLEAALIMPLVLYFFINILGIFDVLRVQSALYGAMHQTGNELCLAAFDARFAMTHVSGGDATEAERAASLISVAYADSKVKGILSDSGAGFNCVEGGISGISLLRSVAGTKGDIIELHADYFARPLLKVIPFMSFPVSATYYGHAWTGYDISGGDEIEDKEYVYITQTGTVYHRSMECTHLKLSVRESTISALERERSLSGAIYHPCERCATGKESGGVYVTDYGNRYHTSLTCPGLKRTIYTVLLNEVKDRAPCSKCGR